MIIKRCCNGSTIKISDFWRTLEMPLINWDFFISFAAGKTKLAITDTKLYVLMVTLSTQDNSKLFQQLKSGFKRTINWNKYQSKVLTETL